MSAVQGIRVTAEDLETGETSSRVIWDDVCVITAGSAHVVDVEDSPETDTQRWTIKGVKGSKAAQR